MPSPAISPAPTTGLSLQRIRREQHWRAVGQILHDYPPGADALVDQVRSANAAVRFAFRHLIGPLYFAREQGWMMRGPRGEIAAMMYLRRQDHSGVRVLHVDDINVSALYRRRSLAQDLLRLAEELARTERRPYLKLAVTVANIPAVSLYHQLGYQEQHHRYFTFVPSSVASPAPTSRDLTLRQLSHGDATQAFQQFYRLEMTATAPAAADLMVAYYDQGGSDISGLKAAHQHQAYAIEKSGEVIGYGDVYRQKAQRHLRLSLRPELWATDVERQAIQLLADLLGRSDGSTMMFHVPSAGHFDALSARPASLAGALGLSEQKATRMIMVKPVEELS